MRTIVLNWIGLGLAVLVVCNVGASSAFASHYRLSVLEAFDGEALEQLHALGVITTEDFLARTLDRESRQTLSEQTGISELEILVSARLCELLQIDGVGPRAASLLRAAGVVSVADLASRDPAELTEQLASVNAVEQLTGVNPVEENLVDWIQRAAEVPYQVR